MLNQEELQKAQRDPLLGAKLAVRRWDDQAKDPDLKVPTLETYSRMALDCLLG